MPNLKLSIIPTNLDFQIIDIFLDGNGIISPGDLKSASLPPIDATKGVVLNGRGPIWLFGFLTHQCHTARWVASFDPRLGAVVIESHHPEAPQIGDVIPVETIQPFIPRHGTPPKTSRESPVHSCRKIAFLGPRHSGKSVFMNILSLALKTQLPAKAYHEGFFILRACPDGEGNWSYDTPQELVKTLRYKNAFDDAFTDAVCEQIRQLKTQKNILFLDCGGRIDRKNQKILNLCTGAIIISSYPNAIAEWEGAAKASEVPAIAIVESCRETCCEIVQTDPLKIRLGRLERAESPPQLPKELIQSVLK